MHTVELTEGLKETVIRWVAERNDEVVFKPTDGFYSLDTVIDAFQKGQQKGVEDGRNEAINELRKKFISNAEKAIDVAYGLISNLKKDGYQVNKLFMNHSLSQTEFILSVKESIFIDDNFINNAYEKAADIKEEWLEKELSINIRFMPEGEDIDYKGLRADGYFALYDIEKSKVISE